MPFQPGISGNPSGRAQNSLTLFLKSKQSLPEDIFNAVYPLLKSAKEQTKIWAAEFLRDSTWGKPAQTMTVDSPLVDVLERMVSRYDGTPQPIEAAIEVKPAISSDISKTDKIINKGGLT